MGTARDMANNDESISGIDIHMIGFSVSPPGSSYGPYTMEYWQVVWIIEGSAHLTTDDLTHTLRPTTVVLSKPGATNLYNWDSEHTTRHGWVLFKADLTRDSRPGLRHLTPDDVIVALLHHLLWLEAERPPLWKELAHDALRYALRAFITGASRASSPVDRHLPRAIELSIALVRNRWEAGLPMRIPRLSELAEAAAVTPEHLCRLYKKEVGCSPVAALRLLRLSRSATMLARGDLPVGQVARKAGFENQFDFSRAFKHVFGVPPSEFRRNPGFDSNLTPAIRRLAAYL